ncbi:MAG: hypothetical protein K6G48_00775 [Acholeplasmatales bacterium]|nr:hypothetical protein [Acholeplasmatales bacterium]
MKFKYLGISLCLMASMLVLSSCGSKDSGSSVTPTPSSDTDDDSTDTDTDTDTDDDSTDTDTDTDTDDDPVILPSTMTISEVDGDQECAYIEFNPVEGGSDYKVYVKKTKDSSGTEVIDEYSEIDSELIRKYSTTKSYMFRADAVGLAAGTYSMKVTYNDGTSEVVGAEATNIKVTAYDRTGFAWMNGTSSGAYNEDGTLKTGALVLYVTNANKDTISAEITGAESNPCVGILGIMQGLAKGKETRPVAIRVIGNVLDPTGIDSDSTFKGDWCISNKNTSYGVTVEGIGEDATANGWGIRVKNASNVEIRNLGFMNCNSNEGDSIGLQQGNDHMWVHDNDLFYGDAGSDEDQAKGDGALDIKKTQYATLSYNHYWDCGKSTLHSNGDAVEYVSYHHNWFDHSDSRHPRIRVSSCVHIYNNYYDGNAKYGVGVTSGSSAFVENNYFRNCKDPMLSSLQGTDAKGDGTFSSESGGMIKAYNNTIIWEDSMADYSDNLVYANAAQGSNAANATSFDAYLASSRDEQVPATYKTKSGGTTYSNFDTDSSIMYSYTAETPEEAKETVEEYAGRVDGGDFDWDFDDSVEDINYSVITALKAALTAYSSNLILDTTTPTNDTTQDTNTTPETSAVSTGEVLTFPYNGTDFNVSGNLSTEKGSVTYGGVTYTTCLKMESSTSVTFTTSATMTITLIINGTNIKIDGEKYTGTTEGDHYLITLQLSAGTHTITKADTANLFCLSLS